MNMKVLYLIHYVPLEFMSWTIMSDTWIQQLSKPQSYVSLTAMTVIDDYECFGYKSSFLSKPKTFTITVMADIGCQSCLTGIRVVNHLGLTECNLIPVAMKMHAINNKNKDPGCCHTLLLWQNL